MNYRRMGYTGLVLSEISYGSWLTFGNQVELNAAKSLIRRALELGINYIDSADIYKTGEAESLLGNILPGLRRQDFVVATKAFWPMSEHVNDRGLSRKHIFDSVAASLERLHLSYVDIWYCHRYDPQTPLLETLEAINDQVRAGKILYWGTSEWEADQIAEAWGLCESKGYAKPTINQPRYSLASRNVEKRILPTCARLGMGVASFSPLSQGILTGKYSGGRVPADSRAANPEINRFMLKNIADKSLLAKVDRLEPIAKRYHVSISQLAIAALLNNPAISSVIMGASTVQQLEENVAASGIAIKQKDMDAINRLFKPGETIL